MIIAIDGPAASGKGTIARRLAGIYAMPHLDTGLLYRATARALIDAGLRLDDSFHAIEAARSLALIDFDEKRLRGAQMGEAASVVAAIPEVRAALVDAQRRFAQRLEGAVLDGRDIGTFICPDADVKIYVTASLEARAQRRALELAGRGEKVDFDSVVADIERRDRRDSEREAAPLRPAPDAVILDTTQLNIDSAVEAAWTIVETARGRGSLGA